MAAELEKTELTAPAGLFWGDEMRVGLLGQVRRVWAPRGVKICQPVELKYQWAYLNLVVNGLEGELYWTWTPNMKQETIAGAVAEWQTKGVQVPVWDRAPGHRAQRVKAVGVTLIEQPPYSPELNPAERVFEELRRAVEGKVYGDLKKKEAVERELQRLAANTEKVKSLAGWDWIQKTVNSLFMENTAFQ